MTDVPLSHCTRIWSGAADQPNQTRLFRRVFEARDAAALHQATLQLFADARYLLWVNGQFIGRGPAFFHPHRLPYDTYELHALLRDGRNVLAVLVHSYGISLHNYTATGRPGLTARLALEDTGGAQSIIYSDDSWKSSGQSGWIEDTPRRCWALGCIEQYDAKIAPVGWQDIEFDDRTWFPADVHEPLGSGGVQVLPSPLPGLRFDWSPAVRLLGSAAVSGEAHRFERSQRSSDYGQRLMTEEWRPLNEGRVVVREGGEGLQIELKDLRPDEGIALALDLGVETCGHPSFDVTTSSAGSIDIGCAELLTDGRPAVLRKGVSYANRYDARPGTQRWMPHGFTAGRYLLMVLRGFTGAVQLTRVGMMSSEPALEWPATFESSDERLNQLFQVCARTHRVGTQECMMDCPTREQALYVGDGILTGNWLTRLTGDARHWRYLLDETFAAQSPEGLLKSTTFSGRAHILLDYDLWAVVGVRDYLRETGDVEFTRSLASGCRRVLEWFGARIKADGLLDLRPFSENDTWVKPPGKALDALKDPGTLIFIDHPGLGWHNQNEPGIDRRGVNAAMNALLVIALRALSEVLRATGDGSAERYARQADELAAKAAPVFWKPDEKAFCDGLLDGNLLPQISQQTNTLCLAAGFAVPTSRRELLQRILDRNDADLARSGPYFWAHMYPLLVAEGLSREALDETRRLWGPMLEAGATTLWETFLGDHLDSYCHPWSGAPLEFLMRYLAGIGPLPVGSERVTLCPQVELLERAQASVATSRGLVRIAWETNGGQIKLSGSLPAGVTGDLSAGAERSEVRGEWARVVTLA
jgi:hypothetical protein